MCHVHMLCCCLSLSPYQIVARDPITYMRSRMQLFHFPHESESYLLES